MSFALWGVCGLWGFCLFVFVGLFKAFPVTRSLI